MKAAASASTSNVWLRPMPLRDAPAGTGKSKIDSAVPPRFHQPRLDGSMQLRRKGGNSSPSLLATGPGAAAVPVGAG
eukprot:5537815-Prorocentrum_lima.AAC.1